MLDVVSIDRTGDAEVTVEEKLEELTPLGDHVDETELLDMAPEVGVVAGRLVNEEAGIDEELKNRELDECRATAVGSRCSEEKDGIASLEESNERDSPGEEICLPSLEIADDET